MQLLKSDLIFFTKEGLEQFEMVLDSRLKNAYRNRQIPVSEPLEFRQYIGEHIPDTKKHSEYKNIILPTQEDEEFISMLDEADLEVFTPSLAQYVDELKQAKE